MKLLEECSGQNPWIYSSTRLKQELIDKDSWRIGYLGKLLEQKQMYYYMGEKVMVKRLGLVYVTNMYVEKVILPFLILLLGTICAMIAITLEKWYWKTKDNVINAFVGYRNTAKVLISIGNGGWCVSGNVAAARK